MNEIEGHTVDDSATRIDIKANYLSVKENGKQIQVE